MGTLSHVIHTGARPISTHEFADALRAICPPRFPRVRKNIHRTVALAISGGVDSMALAYLCSRLRRLDPHYPIADNPVGSFRGFVVDHALREGSDKEASAVSNALFDLGILPTVTRLNWAKVFDRYTPTPKDLPNMESLARRLRYRALGRLCADKCLASMLFAHHQDDQYETVLMRLLQGHGVRGLRGIRAASEIPECNGLYGAHQSGYIEDQKSTHPFINPQPPARLWKRLQKELKRSLRRLIMEEDEQRKQLMGDTDLLDELDYLDWSDRYGTNLTAPIDAPGVDIEDGGVVIYRPLLEFSKDRIIATCEANKVPWWEDHTNQDQTVTMRNAVRHMSKHYNLPLALQKPSILALARRCEQRARALDAEATRLLARTFVHDVDSHSGTAWVQFPDYGPSQTPRDVSCPRRRDARVMRQREVAGLLVQRIIALVSPEEQIVPLANLQNVISFLFPALAIPGTPDIQVQGSPKAFAIAGVHFVPVQPSSKSKSASRRTGQAEGLTWYLSRAPYPSNLPVPRHRAKYWALGRGWPGKEKAANGEPEYRWCKWTPWHLWDGRFWVRMRYRLPYRVILQPFVKEHAKPFRDQLPPDERDRLLALLKRHAPGKTRYTLPALYIEEDLDLNRVEPRPWYPVPPCALTSADQLNNKDDPTSQHPRVIDQSKLKLVSLPSIDVHVPELGKWLEYEIRYRRIDRATLNTAGTSKRRKRQPHVSSVPRRASTNGRYKLARSRTRGKLVFLPPRASSSSSPIAATRKSRVISR
ncbi:adenine nucleotide alpha hydrolases-like protein [Poronia punctata]|nr:adenine nucleotide alpha hydrolases-like protein [Poronia punctata]